MKLSENGKHVRKAQVSRWSKMSEDGDASESANCQKPQTVQKLQNCRGSDATWWMKLLIGENMLHVMLELKSSDL